MHSHLRTLRSIALFGTILLLAPSCGDNDRSNCLGGELVCDGRCIDVASDPDHCGACGAACAAGQVCDLGRCSDACDSGTAVCDGRCRDLDTDVANCGDCGLACDDAEVCSGGGCAAECTSAYATCDGACRDLRADPLHCGECSRACTTDQVCADGVCSAVCGADLTACGGACRDLDSDADHCGACGTACDVTQVCNVGVCADTCDSGLTACSGDCVDLDSDGRHCGACGTACAIGEGCGGGTCGDTQDPPTFTSAAVTAVDEDVAYTYAIVVNDLDAGDSLMIIASTLPSWLTFTDHGNGTATLSGSPAQADVGTHPVLLVVTDGHADVEQAFDIVVTAVDDAPVFTTTPVITGTDGVAYDYDVEVTDEEGATLTVLATTLPAWLTFTDVGGGAYTLAGTPTAAELGAHDVVLEASDGTSTTTQSFTITVADVNDLPVFTSTPILVATEEAAYDYAVTASDADVGSTLSFSAPTLPAWLVLSNAGDGTASLSGSPTNADVGSHLVELVVSDGIAQVTQSFTIVVSNVNDAPTFTSTAITTATEDVAYAYTIATADVDVGDVVTITSSTLPGWLTLSATVDGTATLTGTPSNADVANVSVTLTVTDVANDTATQSFTIVITPVDDAPAFTSSGITSATEDLAYTYAITTSDEESATLAIVASTVPSWLTFSALPNGTATLSGTPSNADVGSHDVTLTVSDGVNAPVEQSFVVTVTNVNDAPIFSSTEITTATEDALYAYTITTVDVDVGATRAISATTLPGWLEFTDNGNGTATLTGTPTQAELGVHSVSLEVSDGTASSTQSFSITVSNANDAPIFSSTAIITADEDALYSYSITTTDEDSVSVRTITANTLPSWLTFVDLTDGTATLTGTPENGDVGSIPVTLTVSDGTASTIQSFTILVSNTNDAPTFTSTAPTTVFATNAYSYAITTADVDLGDTRTISAGAMPSWLTLDDNGDGTATLSGTPAVSDAGTSSITLTVNDGDSTATQTFTITVTTQPPVAIAHAYSVIGNTEILVESSPAALAVARGNVFSTSTNDLLIGATDPDTDPTTLTATLGTGPANGSLVLQNDGSFSYVPNAGFNGTDSFTFTLSDGTNTSNIAIATLNVASRVWYVNDLTNADNAGAKNPVGGNGTSVDAFDALPAFETATTFPGDVIFVAAGDSPYDSLDADGLDLSASQALIGQAADLVVSGTPLSIGNPLLRPTILGTAGPGVSLGNGNTIAGIAFEATTNACVLGVGASNGTLVDVTMTTGSGGSGIALNSHGGAFTFVSGGITGAAGTSVGLSLSGATSPTVSLTNVAIIDTRVGILMSGSAADVSVSGGGISLAGGRPIDVTASASGGSLVFAAGASIAASGVAVGDGISVVANGFVFDMNLQNVSLSGTAGSDDAIALSGFGTGSVVSFVGVTTLSGFAGDGIELLGTTPTSNQGTFTFADLQTSTIASTDVRVANGRPTLTVHVHPGTGITNTAGRSVSVTGTSSASVLFDTGAISDVAGGFDLSGNANSTITFDSAVTVTPVANTIGVLATSNTGTALRFGTLSVTTSGAIGINAGPAASLNVSTGALSTTNALGLSLASITSGVVTLTNTTVGNNAGGGVAISACGGTIDLGSTSITNTNGIGVSMAGGGTLRTTSGTVATTAGKAFDLDGVIADVVLGTIASTSSATEGVRLNAVTGSFVVNDNLAGTTNDLDVNLAATSGIAILGSSVAFNASSIDIDGSGGSGIALTSDTGSITIGSGDVATSAGTEVAVSGGTANVSLGSSITNVSGKALTINATTGGTIAMTGGITCDGTGVTIGSNSGGSITLAGTLDVDTTTNTAFDITANTSSVTLAGTLDVQTTSGRGINVLGTGPASTFSVTGSANVVASTTGTAVSIVNSSLGAANATFRSIAANGAANGIVLTNTGANGDFFVTGVATTLGSGGTISNTTGSAMLLTNVSGVHVSNLDMTALGASGIESTSGTVDALDLVNVRITNAGNAVNEAGVYITSNLTGPCSITSTTITGSSENDVELVQTGGTLTLSIASSTFSLNGVALGASGLLLETRNSAVATVTVTGSTFAQHQVNHIRASAIDASDLTLNVTGSVFTATPANPTINGIVLSNAANADLTFDVDNNTFTGPTSVSSLTLHTALVVTALADSTINAPINGYFRNNGAISNQNVGVAIDVRGNAPHAIGITNNAFGNVRTRGIDYISGDNVGDASAGSVTITNNSCTATASGADTCALVTPTMSSSLCTNVRQNVFTGAIASVDMSVSAPATIRLESSGTDCGGACANADAHLNARNTLNPGATTFGVTLAAPGTCALPSL